MTVFQILLAKAFALVPLRHRFRVVMRVSTPMAALLDAVLFVLRRRLRLATSREYAIAFLLGTLDEHRVEYVMPPTTDDVPALRAAAESTGVLMVSTHANAGLTRLGLRDLCDANVPVVVVSGAPNFPIAGRGRGLRTIAPEGAFLVAVRSCWRRGEIVGSMVDTTPLTGNRRVHQEDGQFTLADPIVRLAARCGVPVFIMTSHVERNRVAVPIKELRVSAADEDVLLEELARSLA